MNQSRPCTDKHAQSSSAEFCKESFLFMPVSISYVLGRRQSQTTMCVVVTYR